MRLLRHPGFFAAGIIVASASLLQAQLLNVDFNNDSGGVGNGGPSLGPNMSGPAVLGTNGDHWNSINVNNSGGLALIKSDGTASSVTLSFTSGGGYDANSFGGSTPFTGTSYDALMEDYLFNGAVSQTITLSGLATNAAYNLVLYNAADAAAAGRTTCFIVNGNFQTSTWDGASKVLTPGVDYVEFTSLLADASGNLVITYSGFNGPEGDVNGFQLQTLAPSSVSQNTSSSAYAWTTLAGRPFSGSADGVGGAAQFNEPMSVATDTNGNVYVADFANCAIRKITPGGTSTTIAGFAGIPGSADGSGDYARFRSPGALTADNTGNLYVADTDNNTIRLLKPAGTNWTVTTIAGTAGATGQANGTNGAASFAYPDGIVVDANSNLFVSDFFNGLVRKIAPMGTNWVTTTIVQGLSGPNSIAMDANSNLFVTEYDNTIKEISPSGSSWSVSVIAGTSGVQGTNDGTGGAALFDFPYGIAATSSGVLYVTDDENETLRKLTFGNGVWSSSTLAGLPERSGSADGTGTTARFTSPRGAALDRAQNVYIADEGNNTIRRSTSAGVVSTFSGLAANTGSADGVGNLSRFNYPDGIALDQSGTVYLADEDNQTIREITQDGEVTTIAGSPGAQGTNDGVGSNARFYDPAGVAVNGAGNIFVADYGNNTIRLVTAAGVVSTIAGSPGYSGNTDAVGSAARFAGPQGVAVDANGILYVADSGNDTIRKITPRLRFVPPGNLITTWTVTTIAGSAGVINTLDGLNTSAQFYSPSGIAVDSTENLYVVGDDQAVRKITPVGTNWVVSTIANLFQPSFITPDSGVAVDSSGNVYTANWLDSAIFEISPIGANWLVTTIGGTTNRDAGSRDASGTDARFDAPSDIAVDSAGNLFVADSGNNTVRKGIFAAYNPANEVVSSPPPTGAQLVVVVQPSQSGGQWRFPWELGWRNSGSAATNLVPGNYTVEFSAPPGYLPVPSVVTTYVANITYLTNLCYPTISSVDTNSGGSLTMYFQANPPAGAGWRLLGSSNAFLPSGYTTNLLPGNYLVEFAALSNFVQLPTLSIQISAGSPTVVQQTYQPAQPAPSGFLLPSPVPSGEIADVTDYPFAFNGQLETDTGYGSGVAAQENVVLTAAHLIFNDQTLSYASQAWWFPQEEAPQFVPEPQAAEGWLVLSGYASQRTNDLESGLYTADQSSPQSRNFDVAALYFLSPVANGGYGGYLPSDANPNSWLTGNAEKMLVGYPVDGSPFEASVTPGQMYQTQPEPYALSPASDPVSGQQEVYTASWFLSYPGNSGGPFYAEYNGYFYPAGVYLGTLFSGTIPIASAVRGIDSNVVNLVTSAQELVNTGTNNSGGGVITIIPSLTTSARNPGYLVLQLGPPSAVQAGAAWDLVGQSVNDYSSQNPSVQEITSTNALQVQFKPIPGWIVPTNRSVTVVPGIVLTNFANYTVTNPMLVFNQGLGLGISGTTNTRYQIQSTSALSSPWISFHTNTLTNSSFNLITNSPKPGFYRALWLTN